MIMRSSNTLKYTFCLMILFIFSFMNLSAQNNEQEAPQTRPNTPELLFKPIKYLPYFKKMSLPDKKLMTDEEFSKLLTSVYEELKGSWLKNRLYNGLFTLMKSKKNELFKKYVTDYFASTSSFEWKLMNFEALVLQYEDNESREIFEKLMATKFNYDTEFAVRLPFLFFYQKTYADKHKEEVLSFLGKLQNELKKPSDRREVHNYYWLSMLMLATGDESKLTEVQNWLFNANFNNENAVLLSSDNFNKIIVRSFAKNLTERFVDSVAWTFLIEQALQHNVIPEIDALFAGTLGINDFHEKSFDEKIKLININLQPYYALVSLLNGEDKSIAKVAETLERIGRMSSIVNLISFNEYNKKYVPKLLGIMVSKINSKNYSTRFAAKEAFRRYLLYSTELKADTILAISKTINDADLQVRDLQEMQIILVFLAASINDEILFEKMFKKLYKEMKIREFLNTIRNQFYRSSDYFNSNLKKLLGKKLLSVIPSDMPFSEYVVFDVLKEFAGVKEIAEYILQKIPEWYANGNENNRRFYFSYNGTKESMNKLAKFFPEETAKLAIPMYTYLSESGRMYDSTRIAIQELFSRCGIHSAGFLQQLYRMNKDVHSLYLLSNIDNKDVAGFVYDRLTKTNETAETTVEIIENLRILLDKEHKTLMVPFLQNDDLSNSIKLVSFITSMYIISN